MKCYECGTPARFRVTHGSFNERPVLACASHLADRVSYALTRANRVEIRDIARVTPAA